MHLSKSRVSGFTLIELLVVISIIGMLASVILVSLQSARAKAKDAAVRQEAVQLKTLFETQKTTSYAPTFANFTGGQAISGTGFSGYRFGGASPCSSSDSQFQQLCSAITSANGGTPSLFVGTTDTDASTHSMNSIMVLLPSSPQLAPLYFCVGSGGRNSDNVSDPFASNLNSPGCMGNPGGIGGSGGGAPVVTVWVSPEGYSNGSNIIIHWSSTGASSCSLTAHTDAFSGYSGPLGSTSGTMSGTISPDDSGGTEQITCYSSGGTPGIGSLTLNTF